MDELLTQFNSVQPIKILNQLYRNPQGDIILGTFVENCFHFTRTQNKVLFSLVDLNKADTINKLHFLLPDVFQCILGMYS